MNSRKRKRQICHLFEGRIHSLRFMWQAHEERAWLNIAPVGHEFGSPDYERLEQETQQRVRSNLEELVAFCSAAQSANPCPMDEQEQLDAINVQTALSELGQGVSIEVAAAVWRHYSQSLATRWMSGAQTTTKAKWALIAHCTRASVAHIGP